MFYIHVASYVTTNLKPIENHLGVLCHILFMWKIKMGKSRTDSPDTIAWIFNFDLYLCHTKKKNFIASSMMFDSKSS